MYAPKAIRKLKNFSNTRNSISEGDSSAADDGGTIAEFSVRGWEAAKLKWRVLECFAAISKFQITDIPCIPIPFEMRSV